MQATASRFIEFVRFKKSKRGHTLFGMYIFVSPFGGPMKCSTGKR